MFKGFETIVNHEREGLTIENIKKDFCLIEAIQMNFLLDPLIFDKMNHHSNKITPSLIKN